MNYDIDALVLDKDQKGGKALTKSLEPEFLFTKFKYVTTVADAFQNHLDSDFQLCLISETFSSTDLDGFFRDIKKLGRDKTCIFIKVQSLLEDSFDRASVNAHGFNTVISRQGTPGDKKTLNDALKEYFKGGKIKEHIQDISAAMHHALGEIDRAARDFKRGSCKPINSMIMDFMSMQTEFDQSVLEAYYQTLIDKSNEAKPNEFDKIKIPAKALRRGLPKLTEDNYSGVSSRVWERLLKNHGVKKDTKAQVNVEDSEGQAPVASELMTEASSEKSDT